MLLASVGSSGAVTQRVSWLPASGEAKEGIRLLDCTYDGALLIRCQEIGSDGRWAVERKVDVTPDGARSYQFNFVALTDMDQAGVAVAFDRTGWTSDNYVLLPAAVYGGNRQRIVSRDYATGLDDSDYYRKDLALTSNPIPQLSPEYGAESRLELTTCNVTTPLMAFLERGIGKGHIILTDQGLPVEDGVRDFGLMVEESPDRSVATFVVSAPGVREYKPEFIGFSKSPDRGIAVKQGDTLSVRITDIALASQDVPELLRRVMSERKRHLDPTGKPRNLIPMSHVLELMMQNIDERYFKNDAFEYYCPENADWMSYGWIGGLINTYPPLATGDEEHLRRACCTFDFGLSHGEGQSGYFYDTVGADGKVLDRDASRNVKGIGLTRKNADMLYWPVKQFMLLRAQNRGKYINPEWEKRIGRLAQAFVDTWNRCGTWGNYLNVENGDVAVYNTTGGAMVPAGLALASQYYNNPEYLAIAKKAARDMYDAFALTGLTSGGCGDILQNADSETAVGLLTSLVTLYETTGNTEYLDMAEGVAALCATWTVSYPYVLPSDTPLGKLGANLTGAVWASTQNKHGAPGFCTQSGDGLFKLFRHTGNELYAELMRDVIHAHAEGIQPNGKITERLTYCDADSRGSRLDGGKTGWNETNGALMALEIPGIYLRKDTGKVFVFDHVEAELISLSESKAVLSVHNPTEYEATVTMLAEDEAEAKRPLGDNAFIGWNRKITVAPGKTCKVTLKL